MGGGRPMVSSPPLPLAKSALNSTCAISCTGLPTQGATLFFFFFVGARLKLMVRVCLLARECSTRRRREHAVVAALAPHYLSRAAGRVRICSTAARQQQIRGGGSHNQPLGEFRSFGGTAKGAFLFIRGGSDRAGRSSGLGQTALLEAAPSKCCCCRCAASHFFMGVPPNSYLAYIDRPRP